ncbi:B-cell receptor CD22-like isoform X2 [Cebidichthys violaceus]|uniref:B-cell receptor CD22-like isoform X2 n=1 Tax=Cebidichthys violaceus TaxID=271503 RepID=UPI0035CA59DF
MRRFFTCRRVLLTLTSLRESRGAAMSLTAAASGFLVLLLTVPVIQGQYGWGVAYTSTQICALKGSTVEIRCSYSHPSTNEFRNAKVVERFWFTKTSNDVYVDLRTDPEYSGRVTSHCENKVCILTITNLKKSDSAEYKFRFTTNQPDGKYTGSPGVSLSVTDLQIQVSRLHVYGSYNWAEMKCQSSCRPPGHHHYIWYKNRQNIQTQTSISYSGNFNPADIFSCAVRGYEDFPSPPVLIQSQSDWGVTYSPTEVCAFEGSTVHMRCSYTYPSTTYPAVQNTFWFTKEKGGKPVDLKTDSEYSSRVFYYCYEKWCTLTISNLKKSDSTEYKFRFTTNQNGKYSGSLGVTLSVTDPRLQINVRRSTLHLNSTWTELTCQTTCQLPKYVSYIWYQNGEKKKEEQVYFHPHPLNPEDNYSCAIKGHETFPSPLVYAPKLPSVSVSSSAEIVEGSSVNLTCSSDANPAANYTWYKENQTHPLSEEPHLVFSSIQSSDSGQYYCTAENQLGRTSKYINVNVKYAPKLPSVSVSPEIVEGSSVTLTCSSDANPTANYTWYKENQTRPHGEGGIYRFTSISSEDGGIYYCKSVNKHGEINSSSLILDVQYPPKLPSVSVSSSAEIVEGSSVTLTCSSDANPAANYIWYKEDEDSPKASGQIFNITDFRAEHSGSYYCEAQNNRGRSNSTLHLTVVAETWKSAVFGSTSAFFLAIIGFSVFLLIRKKRATRQSSEPVEVPDNREQPVERDDIHYASVHFANNQTDPIYSNVRPAERRIYDEVEYAAVKFKSAGTSPSQENGEDPDELYSTVNKPAEHNRNR